MNCYGKEGGLRQEKSWERKSRGVTQRKMGGELSRCLDRSLMRVNLVWIQTS